MRIPSKPSLESAGLSIQIILRRIDTLMARPVAVKFLPEMRPSRGGERHGHDKSSPLQSHS